MSTGLLRGLAARALGLEAPLRSQRARGLNMLPGRPGLEDDAVPVGAAAPFSAAPDVHRHLPHAQSEPAVEVPEVSMPGEVPGTTAPVVRPGLIADPAPRPGRHQPSQAVQGHAPAPAERQDPGVMRATVTTTPPRPEAPATPASKSFEAPTMQAIQSATPEPLLPLTVPTALPRPVEPVVAATLRRGPAQRAGSGEALTEVHVSIGRVELTALAPASSGRATARREAPAGRSLADYLRGGGPGGRKPT